MQDEQLNFSATRLMGSWMNQQRVSLAVSSDSANMLLLMGVLEDGTVNGRLRPIPACKALHANDATLWMSSSFQVLRMPEVMRAGGAPRELTDAFFVPRLAWSTGEIGVEDIAVLTDGSCVLASSLYSCLATVDPVYSMQPLWRPRFIDAIAREDRCHLNGVAARDGVPAFVTCLSTSNTARGWRNAPVNGGVLLDVASGEVIASGLSSPQSPRWYAGKLWLLNAGTGEFGHVELDTGRFVPVAFCSGFARGLSFIDGYAAIGVSLLREDTPVGKPLASVLANKGVRSRCAVLIVDLESGDVCHSLTFTSGVRDVFGVEFLRGATRPGTIDYQSDEFLTRVDVPSQELPADTWPSL